MPRNKPINIQTRILDFIHMNSTGSTISDIAKGLDASRTTILKYIRILTKENKIRGQKVGKYTLFWISGNEKPLGQEILKFYEGLLYSLKQNFPNKQELFKQVGRQIAEYYCVPMGNFQSLLQDLYLNSKNLSFAIVMETFKELLPYKIIFHDPIELTGIKLTQQKGQFQITYTNSRFLTKDLFYHGYIVSGYLEALHEKAIGKPFRCDVTKIEFLDDPQKSFVELTIGIQ